MKTVKSEKGVKVMKGEQGPAAAMPAPVRPVTAGQRLRARKAQHPASRALAPLRVVDEVAVAKAAEAEAAAGVKVRWISLRVPLADVPDNRYVSRHVEALLTAPQAALLAELYWGLRGANATLAGGAHIDSLRDVLRWLTEQLK